MRTGNSTAKWLYALKLHFQLLFVHSNGKSYAAKGKINKMQFLYNIIERGWKYKSNIIHCISQRGGGRLMPLTLSECIIDVSCTPTSSPRHQLNPSIDQTFRKPNSNRSWSANDSITTLCHCIFDRIRHWSGANLWSGSDKELLDFVKLQITC